MAEVHHVIIVGSGIAGLAAADLLSAHGLRVLVVDDNACSGGQLLRQPIYGKKPNSGFEPDRIKRRGSRLSTALKHRRVEMLQNAQVLGIYPENTLLVEAPPGRAAEYRAQAVVLATGARERQVPFKGWTLPGVISTGGAQILMKGSRILPGVKPLIAGCGPLLFVVAAEILANRGKVMGILDLSSAAKKLNVFGAGPAIGSKLFEGALCLARLAAARVPLWQRRRVVEARGSRCLEAVVAARVDARGRVRPGTERVYPVDTLAMGHGFAPNIELPLQAGCRVRYADAAGGWHVAVNAAMQTSVAGIHAVGETTGIGGGGKSLVEGRLAAWHILKAMGRVKPTAHRRHVATLERRRRRQVIYGGFINRLCQPPPALYADLPDETLICRCEEIRLGEIRRAMGNGFTTLDGLKRATRCGMGLCQGRTCGPILIDLLRHVGRGCPEAIGPPSSRAPVKTVTLGALARMTALHGTEEGALE
jgi:D-hydroxyproline dehydrogenase subunit alpha